MGSGVSLEPSGASFFLLPILTLGLRAPNPGGAVTWGGGKREGDRTWPERPA